MSSKLQTSANMEVIPTYEYHDWLLSMQDEEPAVFSFAGTESARFSGTVKIFWSYPRQPLTLIIETLLPEKKCPFEVNFREGCMNQMQQVWQIIDGKEIEKVTSADRASLACDSNHQVVVKMLPPDGAAYGCEIVYNTMVGACTYASV